MQNLQDHNKFTMKTFRNFAWHEDQQAQIFASRYQIILVVIDQKPALF